MPIKHSEEGWWADGPFIYGGSDKAGFFPRIADTSVADGDEEGLTEEEAEANAARIVGCVNGCQGIEDPERTVPEMVELLQELQRRTNRGYADAIVRPRELRRLVDRLDVL